MKLYRISLISGIFLLVLTHVMVAQESVLDLYYSGNFSKVIEHTSEAISSGDTAFNNFYLKALAEAQVGKTGDAILTLQHALQLYPDDLRVIRMVAGQYFEAGDYVRAWSSYTALVQTDSADVASWLKLADIASFRQQYNQAVEALQQVLLIDSINLPSLMMMGDILNRHNNSGAVIYYERAYRLYPDNQKAAYALGNWYIKANKAWAAIPICEHILGIDSTSIKFRKLMGYAYYKTGDPAPAIHHFEHALNFGDSTAFTYKFKGISHYLLVDFTGAIESLQLATAKDSMDAEVHFFLGASLATTAAKKEAMDHLDKSLELMMPEPGIESRIYSEQGNIMRLEMKYEKAYAFYNQAWEVDSTNLMALYFMASILDNSMHRSKEALVDYQRYIDELDQLLNSAKTNQQVLSIRTIVEDRIVMLKEELFFLDQ